MVRSEELLVGLLTERAKVRQGGQWEHLLPIQAEVLSSGDAVPGQVGPEVGQHGAEAFARGSGREKSDGVGGGKFGVGRGEVRGGFIHGLTQGVFGFFRLGEELEEGGGWIVAGQVGIDHRPALFQQPGGEVRSLGGHFQADIAQPSELALQDLLEARLPGIEQVRLLDEQLLE
jgi:hypothetical protein